MNHDTFKLLAGFLKKGNSLKLSINRIKNDTLRNFPLEQEKSGGQKISQYTAEVLRQIEYAHLAFP